jgi:hypothetical protein
MQGRYEIPQAMEFLTKIQQTQITMSCCLRGGGRSPERSCSRTVLGAFSDIVLFKFKRKLSRVVETNQNKANVISIKIFIESSNVQQDQK